MRKIINQNPWFFVAFVIIMLFGLLLIYRLGFWSMVKDVSALPERLRDITFPIWDKYTFSEHGFLVFVSLNDFKEGVAYSHHSYAYLFFMYLFYKIEMFVPQLPMRAVVPAIEMTACILTVLYIALSGKKEKIKFHQGVLLLLAILFLLTMPTYWISAGKFNVDNPAHFLFPFLLLVAYRLAQGYKSGYKLWLPLGALCIVSPITGALLGAYLIVSSITKDGVLKNVFRLGLLVIFVSVIVYLQPIIISKFLEFSSNNSGWKSRAGLNGSVSYFTNVFNSVFKPFFPRPFYLVLIPMIFLSIQFFNIRLQSKTFMSENSERGFSLGLFYGLIFSNYMITSLLWPQAVSIHPYIFDFMLIGPVAVWIILNFSHYGLLQKHPQIWIWILLFFISFNLQQIAQAGHCDDCYYPSWLGNSFF